MAKVNIFPSNSSWPEIYQTISGNGKFHFVPNGHGPFHVQDFRDIEVHFSVPLGAANEAKPVRNLEVLNLALFAAFVRDLEGLAHQLDLGSPLQLIPEKKQVSYN